MALIPICCDSDSIHLEPVTIEDRNTVVQFDLPEGDQDSASGRTVTAMMDTTEAARRFRNLRRMMGLSLRRAVQFRRLVEDNAHLEVELFTSIRLLLIMICFLDRRRTRERYYLAEAVLSSEQLHAKVATLLAEIHQTVLADRALPSGFVLRAHALGEELAEQRQFLEKMADRVSIEHHDSGRYYHELGR